jgi:hypothetical protein
VCTGPWEPFDSELEFLSYILIQSMSLVCVSVYLFVLLFLAEVLFVTTANQIIHSIESTEIDDSVVHSRVDGPQAATVVPCPLKTRKSAHFLG